jgi:putative acetyltransferase
MKDLVIERTDSKDINFQKLVALLDEDLARRNGASNDFFAQYNKIDLIKHVVVAYLEGNPIGCAAMKPYDADTMELKRMYVIPAYRGRGIASAILQSLENWAGELAYKKCVLETGDQMPEAIALYRKRAYTVIPNYGQYVAIASSICFAKNL